VTGGAGGDAPRGAGVVAPVRSVRPVGDEAVAMVRGGRGPSVVYLHGLCDVHGAWPGERFTPFLAGLAARFDVIAPALPGYDGSTGLEVLDDVEDYVWHLADLWGDLGLGPVDVVGHSLGGWLAAELALRRPELVRRMVLVAPLGAHRPGLEVTPFFGAVAPRGVGGTGEARRILFGDPEGSAARAALPDDMELDHQLRWYGGLAGAARLGWKAPHFQSRKLTARLRRITAETLVVAGGRDGLVPPPLARVWADGLARARLVEVGGAGHSLVLEAPDAAHTVAAFLGEPPSPGASL